MVNVFGSLAPFTESILQCELNLDVNCAFMRREERKKTEGGRRNKKGAAVAGDWWWRGTMVVGSLDKIQQNYTSLFSLQEDKLIRAQLPLIFVWWCCRSRRHSLQLHIGISSTSRPEPQKESATQQSGTLTFPESSRCSPVASSGTHISFWQTAAELIPKSTNLVALCSNSKATAALRVNADIDSFCCSNISFHNKRIK